MQVNNSKVENIYKISFWIFCILAGGAAIVFALLAYNQNIWLDEAYSVLVADKRMENIIKELTTDTSPPFYYILFSVWIKLFGIKEFAIQAFSGLSYLCSLLGVYLFSKHIYKNQKTALICAFFYSISPIAIHQAITIRMYSLLACLTIFSTYFFVRIFSSEQINKLTLDVTNIVPNAKNAPGGRLFSADNKLFKFLLYNKLEIKILYCILTICGTFTHYFFQFAILAQIIGYFSVFVSKKNIKQFFLLLTISLLPFYLLWAPLILKQTNNNSLSWITLYPFTKSIFSILFEQFILSKYIILAILIIILIRTIIWDRERGIGFCWQYLKDIVTYMIEKKNLFLLILFTVTIISPLLFSFIQPVYTPWRGILIGLFPLSILIGAFIVRFSNKYIVLVLCFFLLTITSYRYLNIRITFPKFNSNLGTSFLLENADKDDIIIFTSLSRGAVEYYLKKRNSQDKFIRMSFPSEIDEHLGWRNINLTEDIKKKYELDATNILHRLKKYTAEKDRKIWVFHGYDTNVSTILIKQLNAEFKFIEQFKGKGVDAGSFFTSILLYMTEDFVQDTFRIGFSFQKKENLNEAIKNYKIFLKFYPKNYQVWFNLAHAYMNKKEYKIAISCFRKVLELKDDYYEVHLHLAKCYRAVGDMEQAKRQEMLYMMRQNKNELKF
ncbi:tetratricopeptide repeat protein [bacterium]